MSLSYPKYFKLVDHTNLVAVITVNDLEQQAEVERMCRSACSICDHPDKLGACLEIVPATKDDWIKKHD